MRYIASLVFCLLLVHTARAVPLQLIYNGYFSAADTLNGAALGSSTPFQVNATFESSAPIAALEPGADVFAPLTFTLTLGNTTYNVARVQDDPVYGQTVVLFDLTSPDANSPLYGGSPHYGVGFFSRGGGNVGVIGDWLSATPTVTVAALAPTTFNTFYGVGYNQGPVTLTAAGVVSTLILNDAYDYNSTNPNLTYLGGNIGAPKIGDNSASLLAVPEPASMMLLAGAAAATALLQRKRTRLACHPRRTTTA